MANRNLSLWPDSIRPDIVSPLSILDAQASALSKLTKGAVNGVVEVQKSTNEKTILAFDIVVPSLNDFRQNILTATHASRLYYPAVVDAAIFRTPVADPIRSHMARAAEVMAGLGERPRKPVNQADSDDEFVEVVRKVLTSTEVVSVVQSLIALVNEKNKS